MNRPRHPDRRRILALTFAGALGTITPCARAETALPRPSSLRVAAADAAAHGEPLVLLVSLAGCPYCERVRRSHLLPLERETHTPAVQIDIDTAKPVEDFDGAERTHDGVARRFMARVTPTVLFLGPDGRELAERMVGEGSADFYGALLEQRLETARAALVTRGAWTR